jgi:hypothetical protein
VLGGAPGDDAFHADRVELDPFEHVEQRALLRFREQGFAVDEPFGRAV